MADKLQRLLVTTSILSEQFQASLSIPASSQTEEVSSKSASPPPLPLLSASSTALKAQVTKLSLLAINKPFTPSAVNSVLSAVNESVLPSLVTAALLITDQAYTKSFRTEVHTLVKALLKELSVLIEEVKVVADKKDKEKKDGKKEEELSAPEKDSVIRATGRVWDACDVLVEIAGNGVVGFVIKRVEEWRDLVKDAIGELEEWDPDEEDDGGFDDFLDGDGDDAEDEPKDDEDEDETRDTAALNEHKKTTLRTLKPIAAIYPAIISNRLKKGGLKTSPQVILPSSHLRALEILMANLQSIPDHVDEAAGSLYETDIEKSTSYLRKAKRSAVKVVESLTLPWSMEGTDGAEAKTPEEDKFSVWSKTWLKVIEEVLPPDEKTK